MSGKATGKENSGRANNFDFLRLVLAILVILSHSYPLVWGDNAREPLMRLTGGQVTAGELAVAGFFILSGFLITKSWLQARSLGDYMRRRFLRIYPGFLVAAAFSALVVGPLASANPSDYWGAFSPFRFVVQALNLALDLGGAGNLPLFAANPTHSINGSLWSIRYEFFCYLGVAAMGLAGVLRRRVLVLLAFLGCLAVYALQVQRGLQLPGSRLSWLYCYPGFWPRLAACFLAGALFYLHRESIRYSWPGFAAAVVGLAVLGALPSLQCLVLALPILGGFVFFYLGFLPIRWLHGFARRCDLSYGMYLYAFPIQQLLVQQLGPSLHPLVLFPLATVVTAFCAWMSWTFVERPFINLKATRIPVDVRRARPADHATPGVTSEGPRVEPDA